MPAKTSLAAKSSLPRPASRLAAALGQGTVPIFFSLLCLGGIIAAGLDINFLINEILTRLGRNSLLVLSLLIPIIAGLGLNFGIVIGAMAGQIALIVVTHHHLGGLWACTSWSSWSYSARSFP